MEITGNSLRSRNDIEVCSFTKGLLMLLIQLKNDIAKGLLTKMVEVMSRYIAGDFSLVDELAENEMSSLPLHRAFREAWQAEKKQQTGALSSNVLALTQQLPLVLSSIHILDQRIESCHRREIELCLRESALMQCLELMREDYEKKIEDLASQLKQAHQDLSKTNKELALQHQLAQRKLSELKDEHKQALDSLETEHKQEIRLIRGRCEARVKIFERKVEDANKDCKDRLKECTEQVMRIKDDFAMQLDTLQYSWELEQAGLKKDHERKMEQLKKEHQQALKQLKEEHEHKLEQVKRELDERVEMAVEQFCDDTLGKKIKLLPIVRSTNPAWSFDKEELKSIGVFVFDFIKDKTGVEPAYTLHGYSDGQELYSRTYYQRDKFLLETAVSRFFKEKRQKKAEGVKVGDKGK